MHPVIRFRSRLFDLSKEPPNPINPIPGASLLEWLRARVPASLSMSEPAAEDWGWYSDVQLEGRSYLIGSSADESEDGNHEWALQIEKTRSLREKMLGQAKMSGDDACLALIQHLLQQEQAFTDVSVELGS